MTRAKHLIPKCPRQSLHQNPKNPKFKPRFEKPPPYEPKVVLLEYRAIALEIWVASLANGNARVTSSRTAGRKVEAGLRLSPLRSRRLRTRSERESGVLGGYRFSVRLSFCLRLLKIAKLVHQRYIPFPCWTTHLATYRSSSTNPFPIFTPLRERLYHPPTIAFFTQPGRDIHVWLGECLWGITRHPSPIDRRRGIVYDTRTIWRIR